MEFSVILPTRGTERLKLLANQKRQLGRMTVSPTDIVIVDYPPQKTPDLIERIQTGIDLCSTDTIFIIEDDDYYPANYFEKMLSGFRIPGVNAVGINETIYLNINHFGTARMKHPSMSSLFCTAFKKDALKGFKWPDQDEVFLDKHIWKHFVGNKVGYALFSLKSVMPIGIKHGTGVVGGMGHGKEGYKNFGEGFKYLQKIDEKSRNFYINYGKSEKRLIKNKNR